MGGNNEIRNWTIYKITSPSGRVYIGKTIHFKKRLSYYKLAHCKSQTNLYNSLIKYGFEKHDVEIIEEFVGNISFAAKKEIFWIDIYKSNCSKYPKMRGMNLTDGGEGTIGRKATPQQIEATKARLKKHHHMTGRKRPPVSDEGRKNMSNAKIGKPSNKKGKPVPQDVRDKISKALKGKKIVYKNPRVFTEDDRKKLSERRIGKPSPMFGKKHSEEAKEKLRQANLGKIGNRGYKWDDESKKRLSDSLVKSKGKAIIQYTKEGILVKEFPSISHACKELGLAQSTITNLLNRTKIPRGEFRFMYKTGFHKQSFQRRIFKQQDIKYKAA